MGIAGNCTVATGWVYVISGDGREEEIASEIWGDFVDVFEEEMGYTF